MWSWTWKHSVGVTVLVVFVVSLYFNFNLELKNAKKILINEVKLECFEPNGDGSVMCSLSKRLSNDTCCMNVTKVTALAGNVANFDLKMSSHVEIHPYNMPEHMICE
jgi:hypothetical protein